MVSTTDMERLNPLHNFDLPCLKWGNQKLLRCKKVDDDDDDDDDSNAVVSFVDRTHHHNNNKTQRVRSSDYDDGRKIYKYGSSSLSEKVKSRNGNDGGEIEATREKLMFDFQNEVGKMKEAILGDRLIDPPTVVTEPVTVAAAGGYLTAERPWNLRTRRAACKAPRSPTSGVELAKPVTSPVRNDGKNLKFRPVVGGCGVVGVSGGGGEASTSGEKRERLKFSVSLTRRELEEDFLAMAGRRLPRKPKKRPRAIQKQLDTLFPGLWLSEITADLYKVPDEGETGKR